PPRRNAAMRKRSPRYGCPALFGQRLPCRRIGVAVDNFGGAQLLEKSGSHHAASHGGHVKPQLRQQRDGNAAYTAGRAGHQDLAAWRLDSMALQGNDAEHGGIPRGPNRHRLARRHAGWQRHEPFSLDARDLRESSPMIFSDPPTVQHDLIAAAMRGTVGLFHGSRKVDSRYHRKLAYHGTFTGDS